MYLLAQDLPKSVGEVLAFPVILLFSGLFIYFLGWLQERQGRRVAWKWLALVPLAFGVFLGFGEMQKTFDAFYQSYFRGQRRIFYSHHAAFVLPLLGIAALIGWHYMARAKAPTKSAQG